MTAKQYLEQVKRIDELIDEKCAEANRLEETLLKITAATNNEPVKHSQGDKMADTVAKIVDLQNEIKESVEQMVAIKKEVGNAIDSIQNPDHRLLLRLRYIQGKPWEEIAYTMSYSYQHVVQYLHPLALKEISYKIL